jgi:uncharacterized membrane-anchored protein
MFRIRFDSLKPWPIVIACSFAICASLMLVPCGLAQEVEAPASAAPGAGEEVSISPEQMALLQRYNSIEWTKGPAKVNVGTMGEIQLPAGYEYAAGVHAQTLLELYGNPPDSGILGAVRSEAEDADWTLIFQFDDVGYVKDEDKDSIDAVEILSGFQAGLPEMNRMRREMGSTECTSITWMEQPFYDAQTNNLTWALNLGFPEGNSVNYDIRMLGRRGVMEATLLGDATTYTKALPEVKQILGGYTFTSGNKYSEWVQGDKVAAYGLTGLVAGGGLAVAAKTGLLAKLGLILAKGGKAIVIGIVVFFGGIYSLFKKMVGGGRGETMSD